jgi:hypothetical protein
MRDEKEDKAPAFKVVDKRGMANDDGGCCGGHQAHQHKEPQEKKPETPKASSDRVRPPMSFSLFVQSLAHQTMMGLGLVPWPDSGLVRLELEMAKETIDLLQILKDKSKGNLTLEEQTMMDSLLYQLQLAFVEISKKGSGIPPASPLVK